MSKVGKAGRVAKAAAAITNHCATHTASLGDFWTVRPRCGQAPVAFVNAETHDHKCDCGAGLTTFIYVTTPTGVVRFSSVRKARAYLVGKLS